MIIETLFSLGIDKIALEVNDWSDKLGITPLECCKFGEVLPNSIGGSIARRSYWTIGIKKREAMSVDEQLSILLDILCPKSEVINDLITEYSLDCGIASFIWVDYDENCDPIDALDLELSAITIKKLADIGASHDIRIY